MKSLAATLVLAVSGIFAYTVVKDYQDNREAEKATSTSATPSISVTPSTSATSSTPSTSATPSNSATPSTSTAQSTSTSPPWVSGPISRRGRPPLGHRSPVDISSEFHPKSHLDA